MADTLEIFGVEYTNVTGIIAKDDNGTDLTFTRGGGHLTQDQDGFLVIPPNGSGGGGGSSDFSTVTMTISGFPSGLGGGISFVSALYVEDGYLFYSAAGVPITLSNGTYEAVMYKGEGFAQISEESGWAISGNATSDYTEITYTGDFTISAV